MPFSQPLHDIKQQICDISGLPHPALHFLLGLGFYAAAPRVSGRRVFSFLLVALISTLDELHDLGRTGHYVPTPVENTVHTLTILVMITLWLVIVRSRRQALRPAL